MRCTVPVPIPSDLGTFKIPTPFVRPCAVGPDVVADHRVPVEYTAAGPCIGQLAGDRTCPHQIVLHGQPALVRISESGICEADVSGLSSDEPGRGSGYEIRIEQVGEGGLKRPRADRERRRRFQYRSPAEDQYRPLKQEAATLAEAKMLAQADNDRLLSEKLSKASATRGFHQTTATKQKMREAIGSRSSKKMPGRVGYDPAVLGHLFPRGTQEDEQHSAPRAARNLLLRQPCYSPVGRHRRQRGGATHEPDGRQ